MLEENYPAWQNVPQKNLGEQTRRPETTRRKEMRGLSRGRENRRTQIPRPPEGRGEDGNTGSAGLPGTTDASRAKEVYSFLGTFTKRERLERVRERPRKIPDRTRVSGSVGNEGTCHYQETARMSGGGSVHLTDNRPFETSFARGKKKTPLLTGDSGIPLNCA